MFAFKCGKSFCMENMSGCKSENDGVLVAMVVMVGGGNSGHRQTEDGAGGCDPLQGS